MSLSAVLLLTMVLTLPEDFILGHYGKKNYTQKSQKFTAEQEGLARQ